MAAAGMPFPVLRLAVMTLAESWVEQTGHGEPGWPLWWMPASGTAIILAVLICAAGLCLRSPGQNVDRLDGGGIGPNSSQGHWEPSAAVHLGCTS